MSGGLFGGGLRFPALQVRDYPPHEPTEGVAASLRFDPSPSLLEVFEHAEDPDDAFELRDLYLGRVEAELGRDASRPTMAERWRRSRRRRSVSPEEVLSSSATIRFVKETFNWYFRDDLYGDLRSDDTVVLSTGSVDEEEWGLPATVKECIVYALDRDWYGYSDSRGRDSAREAVAAYESARMPSDCYTADNVALTLGGTFAVNSLSDFILTGRPGSSPALCGIPNYPPLVEAISRRRSVDLVPTPLDHGVTSLRGVIDALRPDTPLVLLQTAANPTGGLVDEDELTELIEKAGPETLILLDECHEWLGPPPQWSSRRAADNVVRISSLSKNWSAPGLKVGWILASKAVIDDYYEFASTTFGGPPSFFYTAVEVLARLERWRNAGAVELSMAHLAEFESGYGLTLDTLQRAYRAYAEDRELRERALTTQRDLATTRMASPATVVAAARYSINTAVELTEWPDSYLAFRRLLQRERVSVFPGLLTFCLADGIVRVTTSRRWSELDAGLAGFRRFVGTDLPVSGVRERL